MELVHFNGRPWPASVEEIASGLYVRAAGTFDLPAGYAVTMVRGCQEWKLTATRCLAGACGENETWVWFRVDAGPVPVSKATAGQWKRKRGW